MKIFVPFLCYAALLLSNGVALGQWQYEGNDAPTWAEAIGTYRDLAEMHPRSASLVVIGADDNGLPIHLFVLHDGTTPHPDSLRSSGKQILWINNAIHAGETDGVDASLLLARALLHSDQYMGLLANTAVCIVPVYNVSGYLQRNSTTRANQNGPAVYGFRGNARHLDLNRDFIKADSRNTRSLLRALHHWDPDVFLETHVSNGADHQYVMELLTSHPDRLAPPLKDFIETRLKPGLYDWMEGRGQLMCPYFETLEDHPDQGLSGFMDGPRYSTGHAGLCQRIGILTETHMLKPYAVRVNATFQLMLATLDVLARNGERIHEARRLARSSTDSARAFGFNLRLDTSARAEIPWKGYRAAYKPSDVSGLPRLYYDHSLPTDTVVPWFDRFVPGLFIEKPAAYMIPAAWHEVIDRLELDGVRMEVLITPHTFSGEVQRISDLTTVEAPYEGRYLHRAIQTTSQVEEITGQPGDVIVPMGHATDQLVMEILEPRASDSYFAWGFFDSILQQKEWFSAYVFEDIAAPFLEEHPELRRELEERKSTDAAFAADGWQQLYWVYKRSPHYEPGHRRYPVVRIMGSSETPSLPR